MEGRGISRWRVGTAIALSAATAALGALNLQCGASAPASSALAPAMAERPSGALPPGGTSTANPAGGSPGSSVPGGGAPGDGPPGVSPPLPAAPPPSLAQRPSLVPIGPPARPGERSAAPASGDPTALHRQAEEYRRSADYEHAEPLYQSALKILARAPGEDSAAYAAVLNDLGEMYREQGRYADAEPAARRALEIRDRSPGRNSAEAATSADNLAWLLWQRGDYAGAEPLAQRALATREALFDKDHPVIAVSLTTLGVLFWERGDYTRAEPLLARALEIEQKAATPTESKKSDRGPADDTVGGASLAERPSAAPPTASKPSDLAAHPTAGIGGAQSVRADLAVALDNLGGLYWDKGDYARAEPLFERALRIEEREHGERAIPVATPVSFLAKAALERDDYDRAEALYLRALGIWEGALGRDHPKVAIALSNLGEVYLEKGDQAHAEQLFLRALDIDEKALGADHPLAGDAAGDLATTYRETGDLGRAQKLADRCLAVRRKSLGDGHPLVADAWGKLSALALAEGKIPAAIDAREKSATILDHHAAVLLTAGSEDQKRAYMTKLQKATDATISLNIRDAPADPRATRLALTTILRRKGSVLDAMTSGLGALRSELTPEARRLLARLAAVEAELGAGVLRGQGRIPLDQYHANIANLEAERQKLEAQISALGAALRAPLHPVTIEDVQAAIPEGAALVEVSLFSPFDPKAGTPDKRRGDPHYAAYVLRRSGQPVAIDLGLAAAIDKTVADLREALANPARDPKDLSRALDVSVMQPIRAMVGDARQILLSPDGALNLIPFGALIDEEGRHLIDRWSFTYLTTGRELVRSAPPARPRDAGLVMADPDFGPEGPPRPTSDGEQRSVAILSNVQFFRLKGTTAEGRAVEERIRGARLLTGRDATERALKAAHGPRVVHIATHGFFLPGDDGPAPATTAKGAAARRAAAAFRGLQNPLLRAGLAFAGANSRDSDGDDGVLTALEASSLDLHGTRLVVLSACETGIGDAARGEGVYGLRRALVIAGAETQVMSLWKVDDGATRALMINYYTGLSKGLGRSEALRAAQRSLLADKATAHPYYWASFVVSGDGSPLDDTAPGPEVPKVHPGARGCGCVEAGELGSGDPAIAIGLLGLAAFARRRRAKA